MFYDKTETLNVEGLVYNEKTQTWGGCISSPASLALKNAVAGPAPNLPDLKRALCDEMNQLISREIEYTAWKRGSAQNSQTPNIMAEEIDTQDSAHTTRDL